MAARKKAPARAKRGVDLGARWDLHPGQRTVYDDSHRFRVIATGRRWGKSYLACAYLISAALEDERAGRDLKRFDAYYIAPTYSQASDISYRLIEELADPWIDRAYPSRLTFNLINGRKIVLKGSDRFDRLRGVGLSDVVLDEYATMRPEAWSYVIQPTLTDLAPHSRAMFIGSPERRNHFYDLYRYARDSGDPEWSAWQFTTADSPLISADEIKSRRRSMSTHVFRQEYLAEFGDDGDRPLDASKLIESADRDHRARDLIIIGVSLQSYTPLPAEEAWAESDCTSILVGRVRSNAVHILRIDHERYSVIALCRRLIALTRLYDPQSIIMSADDCAVLTAALEREELASGYVVPVETREAESLEVSTSRITMAIQPLLARNKLSSVSTDALRTQIERWPDDMSQASLLGPLSWICEEARDSEPPDDVYEWEPLDRVVGL